MIKGECSMSDVVKQVDSAWTDLPRNIPRNGLRLWPAIVIIVALGLARVWALMGETSPSKFFGGLIIAPVLVTLLLNLWWLFASRLRWGDRLLGTGAFFTVAAATLKIAGKDFPPMALIMYALPVAALAWVGWLILSWTLAWPVRRLGLLLAFLGVGTYYSLLRVDGMDGSFNSKISWRWTPTSEAKLLSELNTVTKPSESTESASIADLTLSEGDWPGFRGPARNGQLDSVRIGSDWGKTPPRELWRHRVGPGWSSFAVVGNRLFTQEQRGEDEFVICYDADNGKEAWSHRDTTRFEEVVAGPGPRATPTFHNGRIYAMGANGRLNCLNAATGQLYWGADIAADSQAKIPAWGFSSSPCVLQGLVSVYAGGPEGKSVVAYHIESGKLAWASGEGLQSYCSTQSAMIGQVQQLLIATNAGLFSFDPTSGVILWENRWPVEQTRVVQPAVLSDTDVLLGTGMAGGTRRLHVTRDGDKWNVEELWTTKAIKPYFNDLVVSGEYLYGFDGAVFMCVSLNDGKIKWRARGYGNGQVLLLTEDQQLLILTETGDVALVAAKPGSHQEIAKIKAIEGKTWNHPVIAHGKLFIRNAEEMACFELPMAESSPADRSESN